MSRSLPFFPGLMLACGLAAAAHAQDDQTFAMMYSNAKNDGGFNEAAFDGVSRVQAERNISVRDTVSTDPAETTERMERFASRGVNNIMVLSFLNEGPVKEVAPNHPDVRFTIIDGTVELPNVRSMLFKEEEAGFLAGAAAGLATEADLIGFIGAMAIPPIDRYGCGFVQGVAAVNPDALVLWRYMGDNPSVFRDNARAVVVAEELVAAGADIVFPAAGNPGREAMKAAAAGGALVVGVDTNMNGLIPGKVLTSAMKRVDEAAYVSWSEALDGGWSAGIARLGLAEDGVGWAVDEHNEALVAPFKARIEELGAEIASGARVIEGYQNRADCKPN